MHKYLVACLLMMSSVALADVEAPTFPATYHGNDSPLVFRVDNGNATASQRAKSATHALELAIDGEHTGDEVKVDVLVQESNARLEIDGMTVATFTSADAIAVDLTLPQYADELTKEMRAFVPSQLRTKYLQNLFKDIFLSIFVLVLMVITLQVIRDAFDRWDLNLDERRGSFNPISVFRVPVVSREALGGGFAFGLAVGRISAYAVTVIAAVAFVLSQFDLTRPLLTRLGTLGSQPLVSAFEALVSAVPGVILAAILFYLARAALRVLNLLLDGVQSGQLNWKRIQPRRVPIVRNVAMLLAILIVAPLMVAAIFGRFGTPLESITMGLTGILMVGAIPLAASGVMGIVILWTDSIQIGDWVEVGALSGEVTNLSFRDIKLVPASGGTVSIPYLLLAFKPVHRLREPPVDTFTVSLVRDRPVDELFKNVNGAVKENEPDANVEIVSIDGDIVQMALSAPTIRAGVRQRLLIALSAADDAKAFSLASDKIK